MLTSLDFLNPGESWPPECERQRLQDYDDARKLFEGDHPAVFNAWYRILRKDHQASLEFVFNLTKRLSTLWSDLLLGEKPRFTAGDEGTSEQLACDRIVQANDLIRRAYEVGIDMSRYGDGLFKISLRDGKGVIKGQPPAYWFPIVDRDDLSEVTMHVLAWTFEIGSGEGKTVYLRVEIHHRGMIENRLYRIANQSISEQVNFQAFYPGRQDVEETKVDDFLVVPCPNLRTTDRYHGVDDYTDIATIVMEMEVRVAQISRILDKHADPSMYGHEDNVEVDAITGEKTGPAGGRFFAVPDGEEPPGYVVWDAQLTAAFEELDFLIKMFYIVSETSPAAFGQVEQGLAESGSALKRLLMAPLKKSERMRLSLDPALRACVQLAAQLEKANGVAGAVELPNLTIEWHDGVPDDPLEQAQTEQLRQTAGNTSRRSMVRRLDGLSGKALDEELDEIEQEESRTAGAAPGGLPSLNLRVPPPSNGDEE